MAVPEKRHALGEGRWREEHLAHPPRAQLQRMLAQPALHFLALRLVECGHAVELDRLGGERGWRHRGLAAGAREQLLHGPATLERCELAHLGFGRAEARAIEEVPGAVVADLRRGHEDGQEANDGCDDGFHGIRKHATGEGGAPREGHPRFATGVTGRRRAGGALAPP